MAKTKKYSRPRRRVTKKRDVRKKHLGKKHTRKYLKKKGLYKKQKSSRRSKRGGNPEEELINAVNESNIAKVQQLIRQGTNVNQRTEGGFTPLFLAAANSNLEIVRVLIKAGANVNASDDRDYTPLMIAAENGDMDMVRLLLENHADINLRNDSGKTASTIAFSRGYKDIASLLDRDNDKKQHRATKLLLQELKHASYYGDLDHEIAAVENAIQEGANVNQPDDKGRTPLYLAASAGQLKIMSMLIGANANVNLPAISGDTPLYIAALKGHLESARLLIEAGANVNQLNDKGRTPLIGAAYKGRLEIVRLLIEARTNVNNSDVNGKTPILMATLKGHLEIVRLLIEAGANINQPKEDGGTPLIIATERGNLEIVRVLIEAGANVNQLNNRGESALYLAVSNRNLDIITLLLDANANVFQRVSWDRPDSPAEISYAETRRLRDTPGSELALMQSQEILSAIRRSRSFNSAYRLTRGNNDWSLKVGLGQLFDLRRSLTLLDSPIYVASFFKEEKLQANELDIRQEDGDAYGVGVTRQWINEFGRALLLNPQIFKTDGYTKKVVISRLSDPNDYYTSKMLYGCGIALALSIMRNQPLGISLSSSMCKLLLDRADVVDWRDLIDILPLEDQWNAVKACMEASNDDEKEDAFQQFNTYVLTGWDEDISFGEKETYDRFAIPSRESYRAGTSQEVPADRAYSNVVLETEPQPETVNAENVKVFIENWAKKVLVTDTADQTFLIREGMEMIAGLSDRVVSIYSARDGWELFQGMIQGSTDINIDAWRAKTELTYDSDITPTEAQELFDIFWEEVGKLTNEDRVKLMAFWGLQVLPAGGFDALPNTQFNRLPFELKVSGRCDETIACLPEAHACFLQLIIPFVDKPNKESAVKDILDHAIAQWRGFELI